MERNQDFTVRLALLFHLLLLLAEPANAAYSCADHPDCRALLNFKLRIIADPTNSLESWNALNPFCNWTGVACGNAQFPNRVTALELMGKGLVGSISPFISNMSLLAALSLQENSFGGPIPDSIGQLSDLVHVNISENKLEGEIPASFQSCRSLRELLLTNNRLSGRIPDELGTIKSLTYLAISENSFEGVIPASLSNLTELTQLELAANNLTGKIPSEIGELKKLEIIYLHLNSFESIPSSLSNCSALREISLIGCGLTGQIPSELGTLMNLEKLYLNMNKLSGKIPVEISNLSRLILFDVSINELEGEVPLELGKLKNLENFYLHSNNLHGKPGDDSFSLLTALTNCSLLQKMHLASCWFSGKLPAQVGHLSKDLYYLNLFDNLLSGSVPDCIGNLSSLVNLNLGRNRLNGTVPSTFAKLGQLQRLYLGNNSLHGVIPGEIGTISSLGLLDLGENSIEGSIPPELGKLSHLRYLYLSRNRLSGNIPVEITKCSLLLLLDLSYNNLHGQVPSEIGSLTDLGLALNLSNNNLEGVIPSSIGKLVSAQVIDLSSNNLSGVIPSLMGSCLSLEFLNLSWNNLEGAIPEPLKQITSLRGLDLAHNNLNGTVPLWIGNDDSAIENLNLSYNRLTGEVPSTGRFKYLNRSSFLGNLGLCGESSTTGLPRCREGRKEGNWVYIVVATFGCASLIVIGILAAVFYRRRSKSTKRLTLSNSNLQVFQASAPEGRTFTLRELEIATAGFGEDSLLGRGGFGSVYKAVVGDGRITVAVKVLNRDCVQSQKSFKRECQILSTVRHRNLVKMVGSVWSPQFKALILEFIGNGDLAHHLYNVGSEGGACRLTLRDRVSILLDIANGLEYLHERCSVQIIHCDLKPQNVLLDEDMVARVADFGVGKLVEGTLTRGHNSTMGFMRGSFGYMPPESGQGILSTRGDVYSFGVVLLETMTRRRPTSEEFLHGVSLRNWVNSLFRDDIWEVLDKSLKEEAMSRAGADGDLMSRYRSCCVDVIGVGIMCTEQSIQKRPPISLVVRRLEDALKAFKFEDCGSQSGKTQ